MSSIIKKEPAAISSVIAALVAIGASFGLNLTVDQVGAITAVATLLAGFITRAVVTSPATVAATTPPAAEDQPAEVPEAEAEPVADPEPAAEVTPEPEPEPTPEPAPVATDDPVKAALKAAIEEVRANSNATNDARAAAATTAVDTSA